MVEKKPNQKVVDEYSFTDDPSYKYFNNNLYRLFRFNKKYNAMLYLKGLVGFMLAFITFQDAELRELLFYFILDYFKFK